MQQFYFQGHEETRLMYNKHYLFPDQHMRIKNNHEPCWRQRYPKPYPPIKVVQFKIHQACWRCKNSHSTHRAIIKMIFVRLRQHGVKKRWFCTAAIRKADEWNGELSHTGIISCRGGICGGRCESVARGRFARSALRRNSRRATECVHYLLTFAFSLRERDLVFHLRQLLMLSIPVCAPRWNRVRY